MNYYELEPEHNHFYTLLADVTHKCQMECKNCYIPNRDIPDMSFKGFTNFVQRLPSRTDIRLIGAEATLRPDLPEFIKMIRKSGHRPTLLTNGLKMASFSYSKKLWDAGLKSLGLSLNGADDDFVYQQLDGGKYAQRKIKALDTLLKIGYVVHINCILVPGVSEHVPRRLLELLESYAILHGRKASPRFPLMLRFKNVGQIGRFLDGQASYDVSDMLGLLCESFDVSMKEVLGKNKIDGFSECNAFLFPINTKIGKVLVKVTDWRVDDDGVPDSGSRRRGRVTPNFKVAPFFEHVKRNEFGY